MKGRLFVTLCGIWALGAADAIEIVSPTAGETVRQHFPAQVEYLARPLVERECYFDGKENAQAMRRDVFAYLLYQLRQCGGHSLAECARSYFLDLGFTDVEITAFRELMLE